MLLQSHPFFDGIDWDNLYSTQAPHQPTVKHPLDTQNFEKFDEQAAVGLNSGGMKRWARADPNFVGYTYKNWEAVQPGAPDCKLLQFSSLPVPCMPTCQSFVRADRAGRHTTYASNSIDKLIKADMCFLNDAASGRMQLKKKTPTRPSIQQLQGSMSAMGVQDTR